MSGSDAGAGGCSSGGFVNIIRVLLFLIGCLVASLVLTWLIRRYALRSGMLDIPNHRSSHVSPTPRGGGLAFVVVFFTAATALAWQGVLNREVWMALTGGGVLTSAVGWLDDRKGLPARVRALFHLIAATWAVWWLKGLPNLALGFGQVRLEAAGYPLAVLGIAWCINLYNFMDGIDGLAAGEAVLVSGAAGGLLLLSGDEGLGLVSLSLAAASVGFLYWNWNPARIFMGDVGSGLLGFLFGVLAVAAENRGTLPLLVWVLLLSVFVIDTTATLVRRIRRGERWYEAHRSHAFQVAVQSGHTHQQVTSAILLLDAGLAGGAFVTWRWPALMLPVVALAGTLLYWAWLQACALPVAGTLLPPAAGNLKTGN